MNQAMLLPHQILGCLFSAGKMELITGNQATCHCNPTLQQIMTLLTQKNHQNYDWSQALSLFWKDLEHTSWFKAHPVLSVTFLKCLGGKLSWPCWRKFVEVFSSGVTLTILICTFRGRLDTHTDTHTYTHTHTHMRTPLTCVYAKDRSVDLDRIIPFRFYGDGCEAMRNLANIFIWGKRYVMESLSK